MKLGRYSGHVNMEKKIQTPLTILDELMCELQGNFTQHKQHISKKHILPENSYVTLLLKLKFLKYLRW